MDASVHLLNTNTWWAWSTPVAKGLTLETLSGWWVTKVSDEEVKFLTGGDPSDDENNLTLFHPGCKLMLVTEGGEGCRYYTPVCQKSIPHGAISDHLVRFPCSCRRAVLNILLLFSSSIWLEGCGEYCTPIAVSDHLHQQCWV
jgi:hypothetical protein